MTRITLGNEKPRVGAPWVVIIGGTVFAIVLNAIVFGGAVWFGVTILRWLGVGI